MALSVTPSSGQQAAQTKTCSPHKPETLQIQVSLCKLGVLEIRNGMMGQACTGGRSLTIYILCLGLYTSIETRKGMGRLVPVRRSLTIYILCL